MDSGWAATIARVTPAIVSMRVNAVRSHEGSAASYSYATGFVVDAGRGIILSNRHVVTTGPVNAEAVFANKEEVPVRAVYRDPVHDFGAYRCGSACSSREHGSASTPCCLAPPFLQASSRMTPSASAT